MMRVEQRKVTAHHKRGLSAREVLGAAIGESSSRRSIRKWMFAPNKRNRVSHQTVWKCPSCAGVRILTPEQRAARNGRYALIFVGLAGVAFGASFGDNPEESKTAAATSLATEEANIASLQEASICEPRPGSLSQVVGVRSDDVLNVRVAPSPSTQIVATLEPGSAVTRYAGEAAYRSEACSDACTSGDRNMVRRCFSGSQIWFRLEAQSKSIGWASGTYLAAAID